MGLTTQSGRKREISGLGSLFSVFFFGGVSLGTARGVVGGRAYVVIFKLVEVPGRRDDTVGQVV